MMRWIVESSQRFRLIVVGVAAAIMFVGTMQLREARVDVLPEFVPTVVQVQTEALGLSSAEVERLVTTPLEKNHLNGVAFVDEINSASISSLSSVELVFEPGTDPMDARQLVQERLTRATDMPNVSRAPEMLQPLSSSNRVLMAELSSASLSQIELSVLARWRIRPNLMGVPGVANVAVWANRDRQLQVHVDPVRLASHDVSLQQVVETTANALWFSPLTFVEASTPGTGGFVEGPNQRIPVRHVLPIRTADDLAEVVIVDTEGAPLQLGDVAEVVEEHQPLIGDAVIDGGPGLMLVVEKLPGASTLEVTEGVESALAEMSAGLPEVDVDTTVFRPASFVQSALDHLLLAAVLGGLLLLIAVALLFVSWRPTVITLLAVLLSMLAAALALQLLGATFNAVLLAGLVMALVVIVDEAVASAHSASDRLRAGGAADRGHSALVGAAVAVRGPLVYATLIIAATTAPLLLLGGTAGAFYRELATGYLVAVGAAMAVALTVTPALSALLLSGRAARPEPRLAARLRRGYQAGLARVVRRPAAAYSAVGVLIVVAVAVLPVLAGPALLPPMKDRDLLVDWVAAPGTSHPEMMRITGNAAGELRAIPGVRRVGAHVGRAVTSDQTTEVDSGQLWLSIDPAADYQATVRMVREVVNGYPGIDADLGTYPDHLLRAAEPDGDELVVRVYGDDLAVLQDLAGQVREEIATVAGVSSPRVEQVPQLPTLEIEVDLDAAERNGLKPGDVRRAAATLVQGIQVGSLFEEQKVFDVVVWGVPELRGSVTDVENLQVERPGRTGIRLGEVADVQVAPNPSVLRHEGTSRYVDVVAEVDGRSRDAVGADVQERLQQLAFPLDHHAEVLDASAAPSTSRTQVLLFALAAAVVVFLLLQAAFASWRLAAVLFWVLPAAAAGGLVGMAVGGAGPTVATVAGLLAVVGITARWLVLQVRHAGRLEAETGTRGADLVVRAAGERLIPVATTAAGVAAALLPVLVIGEVAGFEVVRPLAGTLLGGLVAGAGLVLFVVPAVCARYGAGHTDAGMEAGGRPTEGEASHA